MPSSSVFTTEKADSSPATPADGLSLKMILVKYLLRHSFSFSYIADVILSFLIFSSSFAILASRSLIKSLVDS
jgi:hypothetical protein